MPSFSEKITKPRVRPAPELPSVCVSVGPDTMCLHRGLILWPLAECSGEKTLNGCDSEHVFLCIKHLEEATVVGQATEEHHRPFWPSVFHVDLAPRRVRIEARFADFMDRLRGGGLDDVLLAFEHERGGLADVSMEVTVRVRRPFGEKVNP